MVAANDAGTQYRVLMFEDGLRLTRQHPWFGVGMDTIKARWRELNIRGYERFDYHSHFHCLPIQIAAERGLLALAVLIWLMFSYMRLLLRLLRRVSAQDWILRGAAFGIFSAVTGFLVGSPAHYGFGGYEIQMPFWFMMGMAIALDRFLPLS